MVLDLGFKARRAAVCLLLLVSAAARAGFGAQAPPTVPFAAQSPVPAGNLPAPAASRTAAGAAATPADAPTPPVAPTLSVAVKPEPSAPPQLAPFAPLALPALPAVAAVKRPTPASVVLLDQDLFPVRAAIGQFTTTQRAAATSQKLAQLLKDKGSNPASLTTADQENTTDILAGDLVVGTVTDQDSDFDALGRSRQKLAAAEAETMRQALGRAQNDYSAASLSVGALKSAAAALVLVLILVGLHYLFPAIYRSIHERRGTRIKTIRIQSLELLSEERITESLVQVARVLRFALTLFLLYLFIPLLFSFFAPTRRFGRSLVEYVIAPVHRGWDAFFAYLPSLLVVVVVVFFTFQALRLTRFLFKEVERGTIEWPGFYAEWALPTSRIVELLLIAFAVVIAFPYLPGSNSAAFKGVSIFLGVLLSLGSSTAIANVVAGVLLTYTRAFRIGDRVQIADTTGDVIEKTLLATHLRTIKNVDVTVPNGLVLASHIVNFSRATIEKPLLLNTEITLGYDTDWRRIHELLIAAAKGVPGVLAEPAPFVLQTALDDFYVRYQVNAATVFPTRMAEMYSELNQRILDGFNEAGVEIMSPHYRAVRQGEETTIPEAYLSERVVKESPRHPHTVGQG